MRPRLIAIFITLGSYTATTLFAQSLVGEDLLPSEARSVVDTVQTTAASTGDAGFAQEMLKAHNLYRCQHGVPALVWNAAVAAYAQDWVNRMGGTLRHSDSYSSPIGPMGENLYRSSGQPSGTAAVQSWYGESSSYTFGMAGPAASGHFTALIWKDAKYLGCGRANGAISCNYWSGSKTLDCAVPNMKACDGQQVRPRSAAAGACR